MKYRQLAEQPDQLPLFLQPWWLDATCGDGGWDAVVVEKGGEVTAGLPFLLKKRFGIRAMGQPPLTQFLGPWVRRTEGKGANHLEQQKKMMYCLDEQLPAYDIYSQSWSPTVTNWLPFYWRGYRQTTRYTYILNDLTNLETVWRGMASKIRTDIRKAENRNAIQLKDEPSIEDFLDLNELTFRRQGLAVPYSRALVRAIDKSSKSRSQSKIFMAVDPEGRQHAAIYVVWDNETAYYLMGGGDPGLRSSGATSFCIWEAIKFASSFLKRFDFEGSMMEPVERFVRAFGGEQTPYFHIRRERTLRGRFAYGLRRLGAGR